MFPWCCDVANRFEKYKFKKLSFRYVPQCQTAAGNVTLAFDFDPEDAPPSTMDQATTYHDFVSTSIWQGVAMSPDLANGDRLPQKNTRAGLPAANANLNLYDVGVLYVLTEGAAAGTVGYVEVVYTVELYVHQTALGVGGTATATTGLDATHLVGTNMTQDAEAILPGEFTDSQTFTFTQPFEGIVTNYYEGTGMAAPHTFAETCTGTTNMLVGTGATQFAAGICVRARPGDTITPAFTATSVTKSQWVFARCGLDATTTI
jgi:hypothetical protein